MDAFREKMSAENRINKGTGLWTRPSLFNHSCQPSCTYGTIGDFLFIFTNRSVEAGSELTIPYLDVMDSFSKRKRILAGWNSGQGFTCDCSRCKAIRADPEAVRMEEEILTVFSKAGNYISSNKATYEESMRKFVSRGSEKAYCKKFEGMDLSHKTPLLPILEMQGMVAMEKGKGGEALTIFKLMNAIEEATSGTRFSSIRTFRSHIRLAYAALFAGKGADAKATLKKLYAGCRSASSLHPLSKSDFSILAIEKYGAFPHPDLIAKMISLVSSVVDS